MRRVAVTGIGVICAAGNDRHAFWDALRAGRSAIRPLENFPQLRMAAARMEGFSAAEHFTAKELDLLDPFAQYALVAAREAVRDAGIAWSDELREEAGVLTGSALGGKCTEDHWLRELYGEGKTRFPPLIIPRVMANAAASRIAMEFGLRGASLNYSTACSSASHALAQACWMVRSGQLNLAIAGGSEAPFALGHLKAWEALRVVAPDTCRPFSRDRKGMVLGEGAAMLILEPMEEARARDARIYAEFAGAGMSADAHHMTNPAAHGAAHAMRLALRDAGLAPEQIGYVNAHGTGTEINDAVETSAVRAVFGAHADRLLVSSTKSMHGHALGAGGAMEAAATVLALHEGIVPPTANYLGADAACDLDVVPNEARAARLQAALSNSFAFGGLNAVLAFRGA